MLTTQPHRPLTLLETSLLKHITNNIRKKQTLKYSLKLFINKEMQTRHLPVVCR